MRCQKRFKVNWFRYAVLGIALLSVIGLIGCGAQTETFSVYEDLATVIETSNSGIENLAVIEDRGRGRLVITGLTNSSAGAVPSWTLNIAQDGGFTTEPTSITATAAQLISPHVDRATTLLVTSGYDTPVTYQVEFRISGAPIETWLTEQTFSSYVVANFASVSATVMLSGDAFSLAGLTNAYSGQGSITVTNLPAGFMAEPRSILVNDPDSVIVGATNIVFSSSSLRVSEQENPANRRVYSVAEATLEQNRFLQVLNGIEMNNAGLELNQDLSETSLTSLLIVGLTNTVSGDLISQTVAIPQNAGFTSDPTSFTIAAAEPISPYDFTNMIEVTFPGGDPIAFTIKTRISGAPVSDWIVPYVTTLFSSQRATTTIATSDSGEAMLVFEGLTNGMGAGGSIALADLPRGFGSIFTSPVMLSDPDGAATGATTIDLTAEAPLVIYELGDAARRVSYMLPDIALAELTAFTPGIHVAIRDRSTPPVTVPGLIIELTGENDASGNALIRVTGLTNQTGNNVYDFTILTSSLFNSAGSINVTEPAGFSPGAGTLSASTFTVTPTGGSAITYALEDPIFRGLAVNDWFAPAASTYLTGGSFAGQMATITFNAGNKLISMTGAITNVRNGEVGLEFSLPDGYSVAGIADLRDPDDLGIAAINDGDAGSITILETDYPTNSESYRVEVTLAAYRSPIEAAHISAMFGGSTSDPANITIDDRLVITIAGFKNFTGTSGSGSVTITPPGSPPSYEVSPATLSFNNPEGFDRTNLMLEQAVEVTSGGITVPHTFTISFSDALLLDITANIENSPVRVASGDVIALTNACEYLAVSARTVFLDDVSIGDTVSSETPFPRYRYYDRRVHVPAENSANYRVVKTLTLNNSSGNALKDDFVVNVEFPPCNTFAAAGVTGTGADAANAYMISTPIQLEVVSYLFYRSNSEFGNKFYQLAAPIDLGEANMPWSDTGWAGFPPIGQSSFPFNGGGFDCANHVISNLFINRNDNDLFSNVNAGPRFGISARLLASKGTSIEALSTPASVGLFGDVSGNAVIRNCGLVDANITGVDNVGGLVGYASAITITNSYVTGNISGETNVGGLVGGGSVKIEGTAADTSYSTATVTGMGQVGGVVGILLGGTGEITNTYASGSVTGQTNVGGLAGASLGNTKITASHVKAAASIQGQSNVGGMVGLDYPAYTYVPGSSRSFRYAGTNVLLRLPNRMYSGRISNSYVETGPMAVTGATSVGGLVGTSVAAIITDSYVGERAVSGTNDVGGLIGYSHFAVFTNARAEGAVTGTNRVGGLVGRHFTGYVTTNAMFDINNYNPATIDSVSINSYATGAVTGVDDVGGLIGLLGSSPEVGTLTHNSGVVLNGGLIGSHRTGDSLIYLHNTWATGNVTGANRVGGLVGQLFRQAAVASSYATGNVTATNYVGGLIGFHTNERTRTSTQKNFLVLSNSYASGTVTGNDFVGGLLGHVYYGRVSNSYASGNVVGTNNVGGLVGHNITTYIVNSYTRGTVSGSTNVGGVVGSNELFFESSIGTAQRDGYRALVSNSYATGAVSATSGAGGLVGANSEGEIITSYWDTATTGQSESAGSGAVGGRPTADMMGATAPGTTDTDVYFNWDGTPSTGVWTFSGTAYPTLQSVVCAVRQTDPAAACP